MRGTRRRLILAAGALLAAPRPSRAQPRTPRIAFLGPSSAAAWASRVAAFEQGLRELGYVAGKNILIEYRWADGQYERLPKLAQDLIASKPDLLVTTTTPPTRAAQLATSTVAMSW